MIKKQIYLFLLSLTMATLASGQAETKFTPTGKPVFLIFSNVHSDINSEGNKNAFELTRFYLGYEFNISPKLSARANLDIGDPGSGALQMTAFVKNAFIQYKTKGFSGRAGLIATDLFNVQEKQWGYRYILKPFQDEYGYGPSADLGVAAEFAPTDMISFDASVLNGEGFRRLESDSVFKYTAGITLKPLNNLILRVYTDLMKKDHLQNTLAFMAGYTNDIFRIGAEYNFQQNNKMISGHDLEGISAYAAVKFADKFSVFTRYDNLWSAKSGIAGEGWNYDKDGQLFVAGLDYSPVQGIKIAPAYLGWKPSDSSKPFNSRIGLFLEIRL